MTMCSSVDTYGFTLSGLTNDEILIRQEHLRKSENQTAVWERFKQREQYSGRRVKDAIRRGIPSKFRPYVWMLLSGANELKSQASVKYYKQLLGKRHIKDEDGLDTEDTRLFAKNLGLAGRMAVRRIITAYEEYSGRETSSGMSSIVAYLIIVMGIQREEDVFWLLMTLIERILYGYQHYKFGFWCRLQEKILGKLLHQKAPVLSEHVEKFASLRRICDKWFGSLFVTTFPSETVARIWDCLFCEGPKVLQRVALATLIRNENTILSISYSANLPKILMYKLRRTFDANDLMSAAFRSVGSMPSARLAWMREQAERELKGETPSLKIGRKKSYPISQ